MDANLRLRILGLVALGALLVLAEVALAVGWARRRGRVRWALFGWGALAFAGSQVVHLPVLAGLTALGKALDLHLSFAVKTTVNVLILGGTAGLFEETARWLLLRRRQVGADRWVDAVGFGIGHGGLEALLVAGMSILSSGVMLLQGDKLVEQVRAVDPAKAELVAQQLQSLRGLDLPQILLGPWERGLAMLLHVALTVLVWRAVKTGKRRWLALAILWHAAVDGLAVLAMSLGAKPMQVELGLTAASVLSVVVLLRSRPVTASTVAPAG